MAKEKIKFFECKTCTEKINVLGVDCCSLRIKELSDNLPPESSFCENIKACDYYRKKFFNLST